MCIVIKDILYSFFFSMFESDASFMFLVTDVNEVSMVVGFQQVVKEIRYLDLHI